ncbi:MAG TPA: TetR/AcrR family transcriptional regulator [Streptosporangiales bacterium]
MGRPRQHDERTGVTLLDAAEQMVERDGVEALSVRRLADEAGTSTRAVYSLFGSKAGLVDALGSRAFDWLADELVAVEPSDDPRSDLVDAGARTFRRLVTEHPALFRVGFGRPKADAAAGTRDAADRAMDALQARLVRLERAGLLPRRTVAEAAREFHALCLGLADLELRDPLSPARSRRMWRDALTTLVDGLTAPAPDAATTRRARPARRCASAGSPGGAGRPA